MDKSKSAVMMAVAAAALYGVSSPFSKLLLLEISPTLMAALLYLGAGLGMLIVNYIKTLGNEEPVEARMTRKELPYIIGMVGLDIAAPIFLMIGLTRTTAANASLLNNFEIAATSLIALLIFKEAVGKRMWAAISLITLASILLSVQDWRSLSFSMGSLFVLLACISWGFENNCTRMLSLKDPMQIVVIKGLGSGIGSLAIAILLQELNFNILYAVLALMLGFVAYGLSIFLYVRAQRNLGAARTSAYYAVAPFIGVLISWMVLREEITASFFAALVIMIIGTYLAVSEDHEHEHLHPEVSHDHKHSHNDSHHDHWHAEQVPGEHSHQHTHETTVHKHSHLPDQHHRHQH